jgi:hypothetical protein
MRRVDTGARTATTEEATMEEAMVIECEGVNTGRCACADMPPRARPCRVLHSALRHPGFCLFSTNHKRDETLVIGRHLTEETRVQNERQLPCRPAVTGRPSDRDQWRKARASKFETEESQAQGQATSHLPRHTRNRGPSSEAAQRDIQWFSSKHRCSLKLVGRLAPSLQAPSPSRPPLTRHEILARTGCR